MKQTSFRLMGALATVATLAACNLDNGNISAADKIVNADVASATAQSVGTDLSLNASLSNEATGSGTFFGLTDGTMSSMDAAGPRLPAGCAAIPGPVARFLCTRAQQRNDGKFGNRNYDRTVTFFDAAGAAQTGYDSATTVRIVFATADTGAFTKSRGGNSLTDSSARSRTATMVRTPASDTIRTWNGVGSANHRWFRSGAAGTRSYVMVANDTTTDVKYRLPRSANPYPISGTIVRNVAIKRTRTPTDSATVATEKTRRVVITFNGTNIATMTVNGETFELNLDGNDADERPAGGRRP